MLESVVSVSLGASNNIGQDEYRYFVNMIYVLDGMTDLIINDINFFTEVESHFKNKRSDIGIDPGRGILQFVLSTIRMKSIFAPIKLLSVDLVVGIRKHISLTQGRLYSPEDLILMKRSKRITPLEYKNLIRLKRIGFEASNLSSLAINIYEAAFAEYRRGEVGNAFLGHVLASYIEQQKPSPTFDHYTIRSSIREIDHSVSCFQKKEFISQEWVDAYIAWNWVFVLGEFQNSFKILPKLLVSSLLVSGSENFVNTRTLSLWLVCNSKTFLNHRRKKSRVGESYLSKINRNAAEIFIENNSALDYNKVDESFRELFESKIGLWKKILSLTK